MMVTIVGKRTCHNKDHNSGLGFIKDTIDCQCSYFPTPHSHWLKACSCWHPLFLLDIAIQKSRCHKHQPAVWAHFINAMDPSCDQTSWTGTTPVRQCHLRWPRRESDLLWLKRSAIRTPLLLDIRMLQKKSKKGVAIHLQLFGPRHENWIKGPWCHGAWAQ